MKRGIQLLFLLFVNFIIAQQTPKIVKMVYWYNDAYEQKRELNVTANLNNELITTLSFPSNTRKIGDTISFQFLDNQGNWSPIYAQYLTDGTKESFNKTSIAIEYWYGNNFDDRKTSIKDVVNNVDTLDINLPWKVGEEKLFYRFGAKRNQLSPIFNRNIDLLDVLPAKKITELVYWYNDNYTNKKSVVLNTTKDQVVSTILSFTETEREVGDVISFQFKNDKDNWSPIYSQLTQDNSADSFYKTPIVLEYWDKDNYINKKTKTVSIDNQVDTLAIEIPWDYNNGNIAYRFTSKFKQLSPIVYSETDLKVVSPNGGETYVYGNDEVPIKWESSGAIKNIVIELVQADLTTKFKVIADPVPENSGIFNWTIPYDIPPGEYRIKMYELGSGNYVDFSDATFIIKKPNITCVGATITPEVLVQGNKATINYTVKNTGNADYSGSLKLFFETSTGKHELVSFNSGIKVNEAHTLTYNTDEIISPVGTWKLKVEDEKNVVFCEKNVAVIPDNSTITVIKPNGNEKFEYNDTVTIEWITTGNVKDVSIELVKQGTTIQYAVIADPTPNSGSYTWEIPNTIEEGNYLIKIYENGTNSFTDYSDNAFTILDTALSNQKELQNTVSLHPNPTSSLVTIKSQLKTQKIEIFDLLGKHLILKTSNLKNISLSGLKNGVYLLRIHTEKGIISKRVVKE